MALKLRLFSFQLFFCLLCEITFLQWWIDSFCSNFIREKLYLISRAWILNCLHCFLITYHFCVISSRKNYPKNWLWIKRKKEEKNSLTSKVISRLNESPFNYIKNKLNFSFWWLLQIPFKPIRVGEEGRREILKWDSDEDWMRVRGKKEVRKKGIEGDENSPSFVLVYQCHLSKNPWNCSIFQHKFDPKIKDFFTSHCGLIHLKTHLTKFKTIKIIKRDLNIFFLLNP